MRAFLVEVIGTGPPSLMSRVLSEEARRLQRRHVTPPVTVPESAQAPCIARYSSLFTLAVFSSVPERVPLSRE